MVQEVWKVLKVRRFQGGPEGLRGSEGQEHSEVIDVRKRPEGTGRSGSFRRP